MISTEKDLARAFTRTERRAVLTAAKTSRAMEWKDLDRLLIEACRTPGRLAALVRTLHGVRLVGAESDDLLGPSLALMAMEESAGESEHFSLYADRVRRLPRLTREQEQRMARRLEFAQSRLVKEIDARGLPAENDRSRPIAFAAHWRRTQRT